MSFRIRNYAKRIGQRGRHEWYRWRVFLEGDDGTLNEIEEVEYHLHPTFPNPVRTVKDRESGFALESSGWGSFMMDIIVRFKDGTERQMNHYLNLKEPWPEQDE